MRRKRKFKVQSTELDIANGSFCNLCALAVVTYLRYTVLTSPNKGETVVHCCDPALLVLFMLELSAYHFNGIFGNSGTNSKGTVQPGGKISEKKGNTFRAIPFFSLLPEFYRKFLHHLFTLTVPGLPGNTSEKES